MGPFSFDIAWLKSPFHFYPRFLRYPHSLHNWGPLSRIFDAGIRLIVKVLSRAPLPLYPPPFGRRKTTPFSGNAPITFQNN